LATRLGIRQLLVKDESKRPDLNAFKVLGVSYAVNILLKGLADGARLPTLSAATEGNHGRALAWEARRLAMRAVIYIPSSAAPARIEAIRSLGAEVVLVDGSYDDAVSRMALQSKKYGYTVVSDTGFEGYLEIPKWISAGYMRIFSESWRDLESRGVPAPDIVFVQGGVGGLAAGAVNYFDQAALDETPALIVVEPTEAACLLSSITSSEGMPRPASGSQQTIAAGLNCALPSLAAWPTVRRGIKACLAVEDNYVEEAVRTFFHPEREDPRIVSGEAGAAGLAGLLALARDANLEPARRKLGLGSESCVLVVVTEGATNPDGFREIVGVDSCNGVDETAIGRVEENQ
jgi:diaminopropionate ammonia-lyase